jgi:hypothetical protein
MQLDLPTPKSGQFLEVSFRKLLKSCYDIAGGQAPVRKKELVAWRTSPLFRHVRLGKLTASGTGCCGAKGSHISCLMVSLQCIMQYVETLSEQLEGLRQSPTNRC